MSSLNEKLLDSTIVITGGSSGIGLALANSLASQVKCSILLVASAPEKLEYAVHCINENDGYQGTAKGAVCDLNNYESLVKLGDSLSELNNFSVLVNCAGVAFTDNLENIKNSEISELVNVNLLAPLILSRAAILQFKKSDKESLIVNVSSLVALIPYHGYATYAATKAGLLAFSDGLRREFAHASIKVMSVLPADVSTPMLDKELVTMPKETLRINGNVKPISPETVAQAILKGIARSSREVVPGRSAALMKSTLNFIPKGLTDVIIGILSGQRDRKG